MSRNNDIVSNKVVLMALKSLARDVNLASGIKDSDKKVIIETFTILRTNNEHYDPREVESWLIERASWTPELAEDVTRIARGILEGKKFTSRHRGQMYNENILETWREEARDPTQNSEEFRSTY